MKEFKVYMRTPAAYCYVKANNKDEAIDIAVDNDDWTYPQDYGGEDYEAKEVKPERKRK